MHGLIQRHASVRKAETESDEKKPETRTNRQIYGTQYEPEIPPVGAGIIEHLFEIGPITITGEHVRPISFSEIEAWTRTTGFEITSYEARLLVNLSRHYCDHHHKAEIGGMMPVTDIEQQRALVADKIRSVFGAVGKRKKSDD